MKRIVNVCVSMMMLILFVTVSCFGQQKKIDTISIKTSAVCGMCKDRIEKAAKVDGVSKADWNKDTKILTLAYDPSKVKSDDVQKKIAAVGHDTEKFKADTKTYNGLPGCCKYR